MENTAPWEPPRAILGPRMLGWDGGGVGPAHEDIMGLSWTPGWGEGGAGKEWGVTAAWGWPSAHMTGHLLMGWGSQGQESAVRRGQGQHPTRSRLCPGSYHRYQDIPGISLLGPHTQITCPLGLSAGLLTSNLRWHLAHEPDGLCVVHTAAARPTIHPVIRPVTQLTMRTRLNKAEKSLCPIGAATPVGERQEP